MLGVVKAEADKGFEVRKDCPEPTPGPGDVLIDVAAASLCGTDREIHEWSTAAQAFGLRLPVVAGHEGSGTILEVGRDVAGLRPGDRVALESHVSCGTCFPCRTGSAHTCEHTGILGMHIDGVFAQRVAVPAGICVPLPEAVPLEVGALLESAGVAVHAIQRTSSGVAGLNVLVNGCGPVGLALIQIAIAMGAANVIAVEPNPYRRHHAEALGARVLEPGDPVAEICRDIAGHRGGFDVAFEVSGVRGVLATLFAALRREATVITIGHPGKAVPIDVAAYINKRGITLRGIFGRRLWDTWEQLILLVDSGRLDLSWLITHRLPLTEVDAAVELLSGDANKVLLVPSLD
jgi:threonine 3-dehydrogenase